MIRLPSIPLKLYIGHRAWLQQNVAPANMQAELKALARRWVQVATDMQQNGASSYPFKALRSFALELARDDPLRQPIIDMLNDTTYEVQLVALFLAVQARVNAGAIIVHVPPKVMP